MKRFGQKVLAFFMAAVMLLAMAGCKKESETLFDGMRQALKMNGYEVEMGMTIEAEGQNITIKADGVVDRQAQACQLSVSAKAAGMRLNLGVVTGTDGFL